jgi:sulfide dehydrogenase cytochrome subunit
MATRMTCVIAALLLVAGAVHAQDQLHVRSLAASCAQCHGTDGRAPAGASVPGLAGRPRDYLLAQLQAFQAGTRPSTIMQQLARGYTDAQMAQLAAFFAAQQQ